MSGWYEKVLTVPLKNYANNTNKGKEIEEVHKEKTQSTAADNARGCGIEEENDRRREI